MTPNSSILILSSNTGGGHASAANALKDSFVRLSSGHALVSIAQVLEEASVFSRLLADVYNWLLRHRQSWMHYYFNWLEYVRLHESRLIFQAAYGYAQRLFERVCPDVLVSVHPMTQHFFAYVCEKLGLNIPLVTVVTDPAPGFWSAWACPQVSRYYVASRGAGDQLTQYGVSAEKVRITGMPVRPDFFPTEDQFALRHSLGLDPDKFTVVLSAGYIGGGNTPAMLNHLIDSRFDGQVVYLTGRNHRLLAAAKHQMDSLHGHVTQIKPLPYIANIAPWLQASDAVITKMGGLTTFEALACEVPVIADCFTSPMPQEAQTVQMLSQLGAAIPVKNHADLLKALTLLSQDESVRQQMKFNGRQLTLPNAADHIAQDVIDLTEQRQRLNDLLPATKLILPPASAMAAC